jgi:hypothetical protein
MKIEKFKQAAAVEWDRLTPRYVQPGDGLAMVFFHACRETFHGFFAPLWMLVWVIRFATTRVIKFLGLVR